MIDIKKKIIVQLFENNKEIINEKCDANIDNNVLEYRDSSNIFNKIDIDKKLFIREDKEFKFEIDFNNKIFSYFLKENDYNVKSEINCEFNNEDNLVLNYEIEDGLKMQVIIQML